MKTDLRGGPVTGASMNPARSRNLRTAIAVRYRWRRACRSRATAQGPPAAREFLDRFVAAGGVLNVLQPRPGGLLVIQRDGVVQPERDAVLEAALEGELERVVGSPAAPPLLGDRAVAAIGPQQIL